MPHNLGMGEIILLFLVVMLIFGGKRLPEIGASLGEGIRAFRGSFRDDVRDPVLSEPTEALLQEASRQAAERQHSAVEADHVLLALALHRDLITTDVLRLFGLDWDHVAWRLKEGIVVGDATVQLSDLDLGASGKSVIRVAMAEAANLRNHWVAPAHIFLGILGTESSAAQLLSTMGVDPGEARHEAGKRLRALG